MCSIVLISPDAVENEILSPSAGGQQEGYTLLAAGFGDGERAVIARGIRKGNTLERIEVPAPIDSP